MGWRADGGLWLLVRGGGLFLSKGTGVGVMLGALRLAISLYLDDTACRVGEAKYPSIFSMSWLEWVVVFCSLDITLQQFVSICR